MPLPLLLSPLVDRNPKDFVLWYAAQAQLDAVTSHCKMTDCVRNMGGDVPVETRQTLLDAVKELALCGLFLASRGVMEGATRMEELHQTGEAHAQIEKVKAQCKDGTRRCDVCVYVFSLTDP